MRYRQNSALTLFTCALAMIVITLGAYTRLTNAGLSCPDWPHCYGFLTAPHTATQLTDAIQRFPSTPVDTTKAWTEMTHRYFAGTEGILILCLSVGLLITRKAKNLRSKCTALTLLGLLGVQVLLGMLTVTEKLKPVIVLSHLLTGIAILTVLWWTYLDLHLSRHAFIPKVQTRAKPWLFLACLIVIAQIALGGWVSSHSAGLACIDFPFCQGTWMPTLHWQQLNTDLITIHMLHRIGAAITAAYLSILSICLLKNSALRAFAYGIMGLLLAQLTLGILNILWLRPIWIALAHQSVAIILLLSLIACFVKATFMVDKQHDA